MPYLAEKLGLPLIDAKLVGQMPTNYEFDLRKARQILGFEAQYDIFRMIDEAVQA